MPNARKNPGRKWREIQKNEEGDQYNKNFQYTPYTTDLGFYSDPTIYEADDVARTTQEEGTDREPDDTRRPRGSSRSDERIKQEIHELLDWHGRMDAAGIQVDVKNGVVTLSGRVDSPYEQQAAERIVENVIGVMEVNNNLETNN